MNYEHLYHAGGPLDLLKHLSLMAWITDALTRHPSIEVIDAFGGGAFYDLHHNKARKTGEAQKGIFKYWPFFLENPSESGILKRFTQIVLTLNQNHPRMLRYYPGSSYFLASLLRSTDRLTVIESESVIHQQWKQDFKSFKFKPRIRGICEEMRFFLKPYLQSMANAKHPVWVFLDPPYEGVKEIENWIEFCNLFCKNSSIHWAIWYPIKGNRGMQSFYRSFQGFQGQKKQAFREYLFFPRDVENRINGSGLWIYPEQGDEKGISEKTFSAFKALIP